MTEKLSASHTAMRNFLADRRGNLALSAAIVIPVLLGAMGVGLDYMRVMTDQRHLQDSLDAASVAGAASLVNGHHDTTTVKTYAINFVLEQLGQTLSVAEQAELKKSLNVVVNATTSGTVKTYALKVTGNYASDLSPFASFVGYNKMALGASSSTQSQSTSKNAMSMYLVLDRSGSMSFVTDTVDITQTKCQNYTSQNWGYYPNLATSNPCYINKMDALKKAAASLYDQLDILEKKDISDQVVRLGAVSFNDAMQTPQALAWGTTSVRTYVNGLPAYPTGGTDMTGGIQQAYKSLSAAAETTAQTAKGNTSFSKFIVLMTDGENTGNSSAWNPVLDAQTLTTCKAARDAGITIYSVAFMAPLRGETMLKTCADLAGNYYSANDMAGLIAAFAEIGNKAAQQATRITN